MSLPNTYTSQNETGCCPIPNIKDWQDKEFKFNNERFIRMSTKSFMHMPLNMSQIMTKLDKTATAADAKLPVEQTMILSHELSPWKAEQYYSVAKPIEGQDNVTLNGTFISKVFEGPYKNARKWIQDTVAYVTQKGKHVKNLYFFYTTCPKCAKHYGKNYVIVLAEV